MKALKENILKKKISYCLGCRNPQTFSTTVENALNEIQAGKYFKEIKSIRESLSGEEKKEKKCALKGYVFTGEFSRRKMEYLTNYSSLCILDFDHIQCNDIEEAKEEIFKNEYVFAAWISPSGDGIKAIIQFDYSAFESDENPNYGLLHKEAYRQLSEKNIFGYELDESGSDVSRLCFTSSDAKLKIKDSIELFPVEYVKVSTCKVNSTKSRIAKKKQKQADAKINSLSESDVMYIEHPTNNEYRHCMKSIYRYLKHHNLSITSTYNEWYRIGQAIENIFSYSIGKEYYLRLCRLDKIKHSEEESLKKIIECYSKCKKNGQKKLGIKSIIQAAMQKGWNIEGRRN